MRELAVQFPGIKAEALIDFIVVHSEILLPPFLPPIIQADSSDDKFLESAVAGGAAFIVTGDKHLLKLLDFRGIPILRPREFVADHLGKE